MMPSCTNHLPHKCCSQMCLSLTDLAYTCVCQAASRDGYQNSGEKVNVVFGYFSLLQVESFSLDVLYSSRLQFFFGLLSF